MSRPNPFIIPQVKSNQTPSTVVLTTSQPPVSIALHPDTAVSMQVSAARNTDDGDNVLDSSGKTKSVKKNK